MMICRSNFEMMPEVEIIEDDDGLSEDEDGYLLVQENENLDDTSSMIEEDEKFTNDKELEVHNSMFVEKMEVKEEPVELEELSTEPIIPTIFRSNEVKSEPDPLWLEEELNFETEDMFDNDYEPIPNVYDPTFQTLQEQCPDAVRQNPAKPELGDLVHQGTVELHTIKVRKSVPPGNKTSMSFVVYHDNQENWIAKRKFTWPADDKGSTKRPTVKTRVQERLQDGKIQRRDKKIQFDLDQRKYLFISDKTEVPEKLRSNLFVTKIAYYNYGGTNVTLSKRITIFVETPPGFESLKTLAFVDYEGVDTDQCSSTRLHGNATKKINPYVKKQEVINTELLIDALAKGQLTDLQKSEMSILNDFPIKVSNKCNKEKLIQVLQACNITVPEFFDSQTKSCKISEKLRDVHPIHDYLKKKTKTQLSEIYSKISGTSTSNSTKHSQTKLRIAISKFFFKYHPACPLLALYNWNR